MNNALHIVPLGIFALLAACGQPEPAAPTNESAITEVAPSDANMSENVIEASNAATPAVTAIRDVAYTCTPAMAVTARYDNSDPNDAEAKLTVDGKVYDLDLAPSASGARYTTDDGRAENMTLTWWTKGPEATLYEGKEGGKGEDEKTLATCKEKA